MSKEIDAKTIEKWLRIDKTQLIAEMASHPSRLYFVGCAVADIEENLSLLRDNLEYFSARQVSVIKAALEEEGEKPTQLRIESETKKTKKYRMKKIKIRECERLLNKAKTAYYSLQSKTKLLESSSYLQGKKLDNNFKNNNLDNINRKAKSLKGDR